MFSIGDGDEHAVKRKDSRTPEQKEFSPRRQQLLEHLLAGQDVITSISSGRETTDATWSALTGYVSDGRPARRAGGDGSGGGRDGGSGSGGGSGGGSFPRGNDTSGPFNRR